MKKYLLSPIFWLIGISLSFTQIPAIQWQNTIGSYESDEIKCIIKTSDGGFLAGGSSDSGIGADKTEPQMGLGDCWVMKLDINGEIIWQRTLGGTSIDYVTSLIESTAGGYLIGAFSLSGISFNKTEASIEGDYWVIKLDTAGNIEWQNSIQGECTDFLASIDNTTDGGYILGGSSCSEVSIDKTDGIIGGYDYWIVKLNSLGEIEWQNSIGGDLEDYLSTVKQTSDGGYIIGGYSDSNLSGDKSEGIIGTEEDNFDYWVIKLDSGGNIIWQNTIGGFWDDRLLDLKITMDGGYLLGGYSNSGVYGDKTEDNCGGYDYWIIKLDSLGSILLQNTIGGEDDDYLHSLATTLEGEFILAGNSESNISCDKTEMNIGERDFWPVCVDSIGEIIWQKTLGGVEDDYLWAIAQTDDGWPILAGSAVSGISGDKSEPNYGLAEYHDAWIIKFDSIGNIQWQNTIMGSSHDYPRALQQTSDNGYIVANYTGSDLECDKTEERIGDADYWVFKLDSMGILGWQNTIGGIGKEDMRSIIQTSDGGYLLGGDSWSTISGDKTEGPIGGLGYSDYWVIKLNAEGIIEWQNTIGGDHHDNLKIVRETPGGGYILGGNSTSNMSADKSEDRIAGYVSDVWVLKINNLGIIEWDNTIGGTSSDVLNDLELTIDSGFILGVASSSDSAFDKAENSYGETDYWVIKLNNLGIIEWQKTIGGDSGDYLHSISNTFDNGYIIGGYSESGISGIKTDSSMGNDDIWIVKLDSTGSIEWQNNIGGTNDDYLTRGLGQTFDAGYIVAGYSNSGISGDKTDSIGDFDYWILKLDPNGNISWQKTIGGTKSDLSVHGFDLTTDGGFIVGGSSNSGISGDKSETVCGDPVTSDCWIVKLHCADQTFYVDADGDNFGDVFINQIACIAPPGFVSDSSDCNDLNPLVNIEAPEILNGIDDNCNDLIDEGLVSIISVVNNKNFIIYPNPNNGTFIITSALRSLCPLCENYEYLVEIYNSLGQLIYSQQLNSTDGKINETISINNLSSGIYFVRVGDGINYSEQKLIIE